MGVLHGWDADGGGSAGGFRQLPGRDADSTASTDSGPGSPLGRKTSDFFRIISGEGMRFWSPTFRTRAESCISSLVENAMRYVCSKDTIEQSCQIKSRNLGCYVPCATAEVHSSNIQLKAQTSQHLMLPGNDMRLIMRVNR